MLITINDMEPKVVDDYDILFITDRVWPITIDPSAGDTIELDHPDCIRVFLAERSSPGDPNAKIPSETQYIYRTNILLIQHRRREVIPQSPEQKEQMKQLLKSVSKNERIH